jgi:hypothetical protein
LKNSTLLLALPPLLLLGCGGGGSTLSSSVLQPPANPSGGAFTGAWVGAMTSSANGQTFTSNALVLADGSVWITDSTGTVVQALVAASGQTCAGSGTLFALPGAKLSTSSNTAPVTFNATLQGAAFGGSYAGGGDTVSFTFTLDSYAAFKTAPNLAALAGPYASTSSSTSLLESLTLAATGAFAGSDANGSFTGQLTPAATGEDAFTVTLSYTNTRNGSVQTYAGVAWFENALSNHPLFLVTTGTTGQWTATLAPGGNG